MPFPHLVVIFGLSVNNFRFLPLLTAVESFLVNELDGGGDVGEGRGLDDQLAGGEDPDGGGLVRGGRALHARGADGASVDPHSEGKPGVWVSDNDVVHAEFSEDAAYVIEGTADGVGYDPRPIGGHAARLATLNA